MIKVIVNMLKTRTEAVGLISALYALIAENVEFRGFVEVIKDGTVIISFIFMVLSLYFLLKKHFYINLRWPFIFDLSSEERKTKIIEQRQKRRKKRIKELKEENKKDEEYLTNQNI